MGVRGIAAPGSAGTGLGCLRGSMLDGLCKSMQPMASGLSPVTQHVQQFVTSSTWDVIACGGGPCLDEGPSRAMKLEPTANLLF